MISVYSFCSSVLFFNISLVLVFLLRRKTRFLAKYTTSTLIFLTFLGLIRLLTPVDFKAAHIIESRHIIPAIQEAIAFDVIGSGISFGTVLLAIWGCGTVLFIARDTALYLQSCRTRAKYVYIEDERIQRIAAGFGSQYIVRISPNIHQPYTAGIFRPVIYLPCLTLSDNELRLVLRHEVQHILSHDGLKKLLFLAIEALFWWNPIAHISIDEIDALLELQCDAKVIYGLDEQSVLEYMQAMLSVIKQTCPTREPNNNCTFAFAENSPRIQQRFEVMMHRNDRKPKHTRILLGSLFIALFLLSYLVIIQPVYAPPENDVQGYIVFTSDNSYILYKDKQYSLYYNGVFVAEIPESDLTSAPFNKLEIKEEMNN